MNNFILLCPLALLPFLLFAQSATANGNILCTVDEELTETVFFCEDLDLGINHIESVEPILENEVRVGLEELGVQFVDHDEFLARTSLSTLNTISVGPNEQERRACYQDVYYRVDEFNRLSSSHPTIARLKVLANALQEAGVCDLPVVNQSFLGINIRTQEDVLHHFLCISNSESVFGRDNIGMGGRGPWGIHPMHNQEAGTRAFTDGRTVTLNRDGVCYPSQAIVRNSNGEEIRRSSAYYDEDVILDNARCAMTLYQQRSGSGIRGFRDWGTTNAWGSNRHCSKSNRDRLQFFKHIGADGCCSAECRARHGDGTTL